MPALTISQLQASPFVKALADKALPLRGLHEGKIYRAIAVMQVDGAKPETLGVILAETDGYPFACGRLQTATGFEALQAVAQEAKAWGEAEARAAKLAESLIAEIVKELKDGK